MVIRKSTYKLIELRRAWRERKQRVTAARQKLRWQRRAIRFGRKSLLKTTPAPEEKVFEASREEKAREEKTPEIIPRALFQE